MRVTVVIHSLTGGGAERIAAELAGICAERGCSTSLVSMDRPRSGEYALDARVTRRDLDVLGTSRGPWDAVRSNRQRIRSLRQALQTLHPDVVVSLTEKTNVLTLLAAGPLGIPVVVSERVDPRQHRVGSAWSLLRRLTYRRAAALVVQTRSVAEWARRIAPHVPVTVIPNAVRTPPAWVQTRRGRGQRNQQVVGIGRLEPQKGFDLLLTAFARVIQTCPQATLTLVGEGSQRASLEAGVRELGLAERVRFSGRLADVWEVLAAADVFVLSSRYEGFPNALLEAMAAGVACVAFDCPSGPGEIIRHGCDGLLVPTGDVDALAAAVTRLLRDEALRRRLGEAARAVVDRFDERTYADRWMAVLQSVVRG
ncbi:MAG: glycosyltransferase family 4 protein [Planctomycetota bacterium]|nr:MAG: glycosyltransferase family 4 protein [Planctomycetota bacterium]